MFHRGDWILEACGDAWRMLMLHILIMQFHMSSCDVLSVASNALLFVCNLLTLLTKMQSFASCTVTVPGSVGKRNCHLSV